MTYCLFIPSIPSQFQYLSQILSMYKNGTTQPDEIIISLSLANQISENDISDLEKNFDCKVLRHNKIMLAGPNRQEAINAKSDVIIYHDSDDFPHKQRIEIIKHFFENYDIISLNHSYLHENRFNINDVYINIENIKMIDENIYENYFPNGKLIDCIKYTRAFGSNNFNIPICAGPVSIKKEILNTIKWKHRNELSFSPLWNIPSYKGAEDYEFCMEVLYKYKKTILINSEIYYLP